MPGGTRGGRGQFRPLRQDFPWSWRRGLGPGAAVWS